MNNINLLTMEGMINIGVILGITLLAIILIRTIVVGSLLKIAGKTDSIHDDAIIGALKKPLTLIPIGIALFAIIQEINPVSYTHLTLPTSPQVLLAVGAVAG